MDVLNCVNKIDSKDFTLEQMYQFEEILSGVCNTRIIKSLISISPSPFTSTAFRLDKEAGFIWEGGKKAVFIRRRNLATFKYWSEYTIYNYFEPVGVKIHS